MKVIYIPEVVIRHFEFGSSGEENASALQIANREKFRTKHAIQLANHFPPAGGTMLKARFAAPLRDQKRILFIDDRVPHRDQGAGNPRANLILNLMHELGYQVTILPNIYANYENRETVYRDIDRFVEIAPGAGFTWIPEFIAARAGYYDIIWISRPHNMKVIAPHLGKIPGKVPVIYDAEAISAEREIQKEKLSGISNRKKTASAMLEPELDLCRKAGTIVAVSEADAEKFRAGGIRRVSVLGHAVETVKAPAPFSARNGLLFVGNLDSDDSPNVDSVMWFVKEVFPLIRKELPHVELHIAGSDKAPSLNRLHTDGLFFHGRIPDLAGFYRKSRVFIAPTRFAAGIPYKIHEAASYGIPVVATELLASQLGWQHKVHLLAAPPEQREFSRQVVELYQNELLWDQLQKTALETMQSQHGYETYKQNLSGILTSAG